MELDGKVAIITGAARGIGKTIARKLSQKGAAVVICDLTEDVLDTAEELRSEGATVLPMQVDVTDLEAVESMVEKTIDELGKVDILVNNAGITRDSLLVRMKESDWDLVIAVNLKGSFNCTKTVAKPMMKQRSGKIVSISSVMGLMGNVGQANYSAAKAVIHGLTMALAQEVARKGITVNTVSPGYIATEMVMAVPEEVRNQIIAQIPVGRLGKPEEIAALVGFLVSEDAAFITGANLAANGGQHMH